jgi:hypothetical protein
MAVKKTVAAPHTEATIPETASTDGELQAAEEVTATTGAAEQAALDAAVAQSKLVALAKARAAKAAKAQQAKIEIQAKELARREAAESISSIQSLLAAEQTNDRHSFGDIREVAKTMPTREEYVKVEIPLADLFDHSHPGVQLNRHKFEPGKTYLLRGDVALEVKRRLAMFHDEQVRLLRPNADRKALNDVNRGSQWTSRGGNSVVPLGRLEDIPTAADERIYTVDFD